MMAAWHTGNTAETDSSTPSAADVAAYIAAYWLQTVLDDRAECAPPPPPMPAPAAEETAR